MNAELKTKPIFVVFANTDLTEGRGRMYPKHVCEKFATATRLAKGADVIGSNATVKEGVAVFYSGQWYAPRDITQPSKDDEQMQAVHDKRAEVLARAKAAGLSDDDLKYLKGNV
jgi:hypothetical protein